MDMRNTHDKPKVSTIDHEQLEALIKRVEHAIAHDLSIETSDLGLLLQAIQTLVCLQQTIEDKNTTLLKLRKLLGMVSSSEKRSGNTSNNSDTGDDKNKNGSKKKHPKKKRSPSVERVAQTIEHHAMQAMQKGDLCSACELGKLYPFAPAEFLRITGLSPLHTTKHVIERLRCNRCGELFTAKLSDEVLADGASSGLYGFSARAMLVINKYFAATPFYRVENIQTMFGTPVTASTQYDQCKFVADVGEPLYEALKYAAAQASTFLIDDTHNKILNAKPILKPNRTKKGHKLRSGVYSSGMMALMDDHVITIYNTDIGHAGELADDVLRHRDKALPSPNYMCDASSNNTVTVCQVQLNLCNAHARRQFIDVETAFPDEVSWLTDQYEIIWCNNNVSKKLNNTPTERLAYHVQHSLPVMDTILQWCQVTLASTDAEHYSGLGKAQKYFIKHYDKLIAFCKYEGALIDNNRMEQALKLLILSRKNSLFYKTENGAIVGNILTSLLATCAHNDVNAYKYLIWIQQNRVALKENPAVYLPWCLKLNELENKG